MGGEHSQRLGISLPVDLLVTRSVGVSDPTYGSILLALEDDKFVSDLRLWHLHLQ